MRAVLEATSTLRRTGQIILSPVREIQQTAAHPADSALKDDLQNAKPFSDVPGPRRLPIIGDLLALPRYINNDNFHLLAVDGFAKYGPIFKEKIGHLSLVHLTGCDAIEKLLRMDGKYPRRVDIKAWITWRIENGKKTGILITNGPDWKRMRSTLDKRLLRPKHVATYAGNFNEVITDFIARLRHIRDEESDGRTIPNIDHELFHWSLETIATVLYEVRLGGLSESRQPRMTKFIEAVQRVFASTMYVNYLSTKLNRVFMPKVQKLHDNSWDVVFKTTQLLVEDKLQNLNTEASKDEEDGFLSHLLLTDMSKDEILGNISELMIAAVDTTSNTMQWILYLLSKHPEVQKRLYDEVTSVAPNGKIPTYEDIQEMPYLRAIIKETLRIYPVAGIIARTTNEDMVLHGYHIPPETTIMASTYAMGHDPNQFPGPESFEPERWLRSSDADHIHTFAWLPFGYGSRMCIGRRVAELEMHLLLARISQLFELEEIDKEPLVPKTRSVLVPDRPVNVAFIDRRLVADVMTSIGATAVI